MIFVYRLSRPLIAKGYIHNVEGYHICYIYIRYTVVNSTRDSIVYFTKDNIKNLFFKQGTILLQAYSIGKVTFYLTCVFYGFRSCIVDNGKYIFKAVSNTACRVLD